MSKYIIDLDIVGHNENVYTDLEGNTYYIPSELLTPYKEQTCEFKPLEKIEVSDDGRNWFKRIFLAKINNEYWCYGLTDQKVWPWILARKIESKVDWEKVAVDTPILVRDNEDCAWQKRHFAKFENGYVYSWDRGNTSWTANGGTMNWHYAKLAEEEEDE